MTRPRQERHGKTTQIKNLPDFSSALSCRASGDKLAHLGNMSANLTACGKEIKTFLLGANATNCPKCMAAKERVSVAAHKKN